MPKRFASRFPGFAAKLQAGAGAPLEEVLPPATEEDIKERESRLGIPLPDSYKDFLRLVRIVAVGRRCSAWQAAPILPQVSAA